MTDGKAKYGVAKANAEIGSWVAGGISPEWTSWRMRWEAGRAASFVPLLTGFCMLTASVFEERRS